MIRKILTIFFLIAVLLRNGTASYIKGNQFVKISVFTKQLRLIKEGKLSDIKFYFSGKVKIEDRLNNKYIKIKSLKLFYKSKKWYAEFANLIHENIHLKITAHGKGSIVRVKTADSMRQYPADLEIIIIKNLPVIYIKEDIYRYAADSALAEFGARGKNEYQAVKALTQLILARIFRRKKSPRYKGYDFSDLTYDQVYRGIMPGRDNFIIKKTDYIIDWKNLKKELFFHAACGGKTFDSKVFDHYNKGYYSGIKDVLFREGVVLCRDYHSGWERSIDVSELGEILNINSFKAKGNNLRNGQNVNIGGGSPLNPPGGDFKIKNIFYDKERMQVSVQYSDSKKIFSAEKFRLKINRVKGWSFIKSNNYILKFKEVDKEYLCIFKGSGLGHGVGLCQQGALELARRGYNYYEIIKHYYPKINFICKNDNIDDTPNLSYMVFDLYSGKVTETNNQSILNRKFPPGSFWKIIVAHYLAKERPDLFNEYFYTCRGTADKNSPLPERCWTSEGHGKLNLQKALTNSCNLYFASLYNKIDQKRFYDFYKKWCRNLNINFPLAPAVTQKAWARQLAGLDFGITFTAKDLIKIICLINVTKSKDKNINEYKQEFPIEYRLQIYAALNRIFISGTASGKVKKYGESKNYLPLLNNSGIKKILRQNTENLWGKTSTVIDGTNKPLNYGMFFGARGEKGIIVFLRRGNGHLAAKWARYLFFRK